jgi:hypothetical protein
LKKLIFIFMLFVISGFLFSDSTAGINQCTMCRTDEAGSEAVGINSRDCLACRYRVEIEDTAIFRSKQELELLNIRTRQRKTTSQVFL